jgi:hypothetical protein
MKIYKVKDINGDIAYIEANDVVTDYEAKMINFYSKRMLVGKIPINRLAFMGVVDGKKDEYDKEELNNET